jgi:hypothetical protein
VAVVGFPDPHDPNGPGSQLVELTADELAHAYDVGARQRAGAVRRRARTKWGQAQSRAHADHLLGCAGELAVACALGIPWEPPDRPDRGAADVGPWHVRTTRRRPPDLIVHPGERGPYVLVTRAYPRYERELRIVGWVDLDDDPDPWFWRDPTGTDRPAYFLPARALVPWSDRVLL